MRLAQVCPRYYPYIGGVETHVKEISERLVKKAFDVEILTANSSGKLPRQETLMGVTIRRFREWAPNEAYYSSRELRKYLLQRSCYYDVVHAHAYHALPALYASQAKNGNKLVFTPHYHGVGHTLFRNLLLKFYKFWGKKIFEKADHVVCVSEYEKKLLSKHFKVDDEKVVVIPNGINLEEFRGLKRQSNDCGVILCVSKLDKFKGVQYLIKALPRLDNDSILVIVGKGSYKKSLINLARTLGVEERVNFFQDLPRNELLKKYAEADVFALLSRYEAYGICIAEALAARTPCVVANTSALKEWVDDKNCFGIDYPVNVSRLAKLLNKVIGKEVEDVRLPDWNDTVERLIELYQSLCGQ